MVDHGRVIAKSTSDELKAQVGGERLELTLTHKADMDNAIQTLRQYSIGEILTDTDHRHIIVPVTQGSQILAAVVRDLDAEQIAMDDMSLRRPTLDDVFLALTGRAAEETDELIDIDAARPLERSTR